MTTRCEIERAIDTVIREAESVGAVNASIWSGFGDIPGARLHDARAHLLALISPPAPAAITEAMVEEGAKALLLAWQGADTEQLLNDPEWRDDYLHGSRLVLNAALAAAQAQPGGEASA